MAQNIQSTAIYTYRNLNIMPFRLPENQLDIGKDWEEWLEEIEREFRYFKITSPLDKKDAIIIFGGREIARLAKHLPDPADPHDVLDEYKILRKKLNDYFTPKKNMHYARYLFLKMRPGKEESTVAYATRLREKARDCNFGTTCEERILEHIIQTISNKTLIQKCISKSWNLQEFLKETGQIEDISRQMQDMKPNQHYNTRQRKILMQRNHSNTAIVCSYCGLKNAHTKGRNCPAYGVQCRVCYKFDHFASVCRFKNMRQQAKIESPWRQDEPTGHKRQRRSEEEYSESDLSLEEDLEKTISQIRIKTVKNLSEENQNLSSQIEALQDSISILEKELDVIKKTVNLLASHKMHKEVYGGMSCNKTLERRRKMVDERSSKSDVCHRDPNRCDSTTETDIGHLISWLESEGKDISSTKILPTKVNNNERNKSNKRRKSKYKRHW